MNIERLKNILNKSFLLIEKGGKVLIKAKLFLIKC